MLIIPINQAVVGQGNTVITDKQLCSNLSAIQIKYQGVNNFPYSGSNTAQVSIWASLEHADVPQEIWFPYKLTTIQLMNAKPTDIQDVSGYRNIIVTVDTLVDGTISVETMPSLTD